MGQPVLLFGFQGPVAALVGVEQRCAVAVTVNDLDLHSPALQHSSAPARQHASTPAQQHKTATTNRTNGNRVLSQATQQVSTSWPDTHVELARHTER